MFTILLRRGWLLWGPVLVAWQVGALWAVQKWSSWDWLRGLAPWLTALVCVAVALWGLCSVAFVTRRGFWMPFEGRARWADVVARDGLDLTLRVGHRYGMDRLLSFDRVEGPRADRLLDRLVPSGLPRLQVTQPHPHWRASLEARADTLLAKVGRSVSLPVAYRSWMIPDEGIETHRLRLEFAAAANGRLVEVTLHTNSWYPIVQVDGLYAYFDTGRSDDYDPEHEDDDVETYPLGETAALLAAVFGDGVREPIEAWQITDRQDRSWDFYPKLVE